MVGIQQLAFLFVFLPLTAWAKNNEFLFRCLSTASTPLIVASCFDHPLPCGDERRDLSMDDVCDGSNLDCLSGYDEAKELCEDEKWRTMPCRTGYIRCQGHRPGQCVKKSNLCNGYYNCIDRSDEDNCFNKSLSHLLLSQESHQEDHEVDLTEALDEAQEDSPDPAAWTAAFLLLGIPLTWILKLFCIKCFVRCFGTLKEPDDEDQSQEILIPDEDVIKVLNFIKAMVEHVEGNEPLNRHIHRLLRLFKEVHNTAAWSSSAEIIFDMGYLLFDSRMEQIDEFHVTMHELEKMVHQNNELEMNLCLKHDLGNRMVNELLWSSEPPGIRKLQMLIPNCLHILWRTKLMKTIRIYLGIVFEAMGYYLDLVKDWVIFLILYTFIEKNSFFSFEGQLVLMLGVFLVLPELIRGMYFAHHYKTVFDIREYKFNSLAKWVLKIIMVFLSPFIPAVMLWERGKIAYENLKVQTVLFNRLQIYMQESTSNLEKPAIEAFRKEFEEYHKSLKERDALLTIVVDTKYLEASTETIFQYILQLLVVLVVRNATHIAVNQGMETVLTKSKAGTLLYVSLALSFFSLINTRVKIEAADKQGFFRMKAKVFFGMHSFLALLTKVFSLVFYFAPTLGLFSLGIHWHKEKISFATDFVVDTTVEGNAVHLSDVLPRPKESSSGYTMFNLPTFYLFFLVFLPWQCAAIYIFKNNLVETFRASKSFSSKILHVVSCITYPAIFEDWDQHKTEDIRVYEKQWQNVHSEHKLMSIWHCCINIFQCIPLIYNCVKIFIRHNALMVADGVIRPTVEEREAAKVSVFLICVPIIFGMLAYTEWRLLELYYNKGHPWARIFKAFPSNQKKRNTANIAILVEEA